MKKLILGAVALMALAASSCSDKKAADAAATAVSPELSDSVSTYYGKMVGSYILADYMRFGEDARKDRTKEDIFKGLQMVMGAKPSEGTLMGIQIGAQIMNELNQFRAQGIDISNETVLKNFKKAFDTDSVDMNALQEYSATLRGLMSEVQRRSEAAQAAEAEAAPEAQDALDAGEKFVNELKANDPEIKTSESGLSYKILAKGDNTEIKDDSMVDVNYVGKLTDGTVFDQSAEGQPATFSPSGVIPGFREGLKMLGKGGRAVLYIPGNLAYGAQGVPQAGIGPNAMLVFEIEVADVK